ncbi:MAG: SMP-30/gluconolactonase/LRE family protein [Candidatus Latescibacterota bacterium]
MWRIGVIFCFCALVSFQFISVTSAQAQEKSLIVTVSDPVGIPKILAEGFRWPEGPSVDKDGNAYLSDESTTFITKVTPNGKISKVVDVGGGSSSTILDKDGNLYLANYSSHKILKVDLKTSKVSMVADRTPDGETLRGPNDMAWDQSGRLYFTDPRGSSKTPIGNVCYIDLDGTCKKFTSGCCYPNGIAFSKDFKYLYIAETNCEVIWKFEINADGTAGMKHFFFYTGENNLVDGMKIDAENHLWITNFSKNELWRISPEGKVVDQIKLPFKANLTNICFAGPDMRTVYLTTVEGGNSKLYTMRMPVAGMPRVPEALEKK